MRIPSFADALEVVCLHAADGGRDETLFGGMASRARAAMRPFVVGNECPSTYFEFPLASSPFLDITLLYGPMDPGTRVESEAAAGSEAMLDWYAGARPQYDAICCGFELDTKHQELPAAAIHFQPRTHTELVKPFCDAIGEPERARLYLDMNERMPRGWPLSFFGLFRGRPDAPLRVCGYLNQGEKDAIAEDASRLARAFDEIGFSAYDDTMLDQASKLMSLTPEAVDFQFDVYPDGSLSNVFAIDTSFKIMRPELVCESFGTGVASRIMSTLEEWGAADERWRLVPDTAFARALPVELDDGSIGRFSFTLLPQWSKARWIDGVLQPAKLYLLGCGGLVEEDENTTE